MEFPILSAIVWTPVVALIAVLIIPGTQAAAIRVVSAIAALFTLVCTVWLWFTFDASSADFQFVERIPWIPGWGIDYHLGVDGFSVLLLVLTAIVYFDVTRVRYILALSFIAGMAQAFGGPAFQSLIPSLVPRQHLPNAVALNSIQFNLAQAIGPAIGGVLLVGLGMAACFGLNGLSFLVVIIVLGSMQVPPPAPATRQRILTELGSGLSYVRHGGALLALTILAFATTSLALPLRAFLPVFADDAAHLSQMMTMLGAGAVVGALIVAWLGSFDRMGRTLLQVQIVFGGLVALFALLPVSPLSYLVLFLTGAALLMVFSLTNSLVQLAVPDELRGRVISIYLVAFRGGMPIGSLVSGYFISQFSAPAVIATNGLLLSLVAAAFLVGSKQVREL